MRKALSCVLVVCFAAGLSACGDKGGGSGGGFGGGSSTSPVGAWTFDVDKLVKSLAADKQKELDALPPEQRKQIEAKLGQQAAAMRAMFSKAVFLVNFNGDHSATMEVSGMPGTETQTGEGTWKLDGTKLTVTPTKKNGKAVEGDDAKVMDLTFKDGVISTKEGDGPTMEFKRK